MWEPGDNRWWIKHMFYSLHVFHSWIYVGCKKEIYQIFKMIDFYDREDGFVGVGYVYFIRPQYFLVSGN